MLAGKKILLAICGSIAAYKIAFFIRLLKTEGAEVQVIMTDGARDFITPLTLATLAKNPVHSSYYDKETGEWHNHVALGLWADYMIIAPLTANTLGKMAHGICDNLLLATYLSAKCPVLVAPAMDLDMYQHPTTQDNLRQLASYGNEIIAARTGELASGLSGQGRMAEPEELIEVLKKKISQASSLTGKQVLITSGPTHEAIDPVRFVGNHSSGKMGAAIASAFHQAGADVITISGPASHLPTKGEVVHVRSAEEMLTCVSKHYEKADIVVFAAAVADYRPEHAAIDKIKKQEDQLTLKLIRNPDIAAHFGFKKNKQIHIGFALETSEEKKHALAKLKAKNFDLIVLNSLKDEGAGFRENTNKVTFFDKDNNEYPFELKSKTAVAEDIVNHVLKQLA